MPANRTKFRILWLILERSGADVCAKDPGFEVDLYVSVDLRTMTAIWMGLDTVRAAVASQRMILTGAKSLVKVVDAATAQIPAPAAVKRALDVLKAAKRPLIILGKGAAYAQADEEIRAFIEKSGAPFLPMSMAKGLLPDTHLQSAGAARSTVLKDADVVMLIGARLNWLLSHGKGKTWGDPGSKTFIQVDIEPREMDSNVAISAPLVGDIG